MSKAQDKRLPTAEEIAAQARATAEEIDRLARPPWLDGEDVDGWPTPEPLTLAPLIPAAPPLPETAAEEVAPPEAAAVAEGPIAEEPAAVESQPVVDDGWPAAPAPAQVPAEPVEVAQAARPAPTEPRLAPHGLRNTFIVIVLLGALATIVGLQQRSASQRHNLTTPAAAKAQQPRATAPVKAAAAKAQAKTPTATKPKAKTQAQQTAKKAQAPLSTTRDAAPAGRAAPTTAAPAPKRAAKSTPEKTSSSTPASRSTPAQPKTAQKSQTPQASKPARIAGRYRRPAFTVPGAPLEKASEMLLITRAERLDAFISRRPKPTGKNVSFWIYQHNWILTGALYGWPSGERAVERLIVVDRKVEALWGIGGLSEKRAENALVNVRAHR